MSGMAGWMGLISSLVDKAIEFPQMIQGQENQRKGQGILSGMGDVLRDQGLEAAGTLYNRTGEIQKDWRDRSGGILNTMAEGYFGADPFTDGGKGSGTSNSRDFRLGEGGMTGFIREEGDKFKKSVGDREDARVATDEQMAKEGKDRVNSEYAANRETLMSSYKDTISTVDTTIRDVQNRATQAIDNAMAMRDKDTNTVQDYAAEAVAGIAQQAAPALASAYADLNRKYAGKDLSDPSVQSQYNAEKQAVQMGYARSMNEAIGVTKGKMAELKATVATQHAVSINAMSSDLARTVGDVAVGAAGTKASAFNTLADGIASLYSTQTSGNVSYDKMATDSRALRSQLMGEVDGTVFNALAEAFSADAAQFTALANAHLSLEAQAAADAQARETDNYNATVAAWSAWAQGNNNYAESLINTRLFQSNWSDPFWRFGDYQNNRDAVAASNDDGGFPVNFGVTI